MTGRGTGAALEKQDPTALRQRIGQRVVFADAARTGRLAAEMVPGQAAAREIAGLAREVEDLVR